ncbi:MAG: LamG domain-containing protein [Candidatus Uhrbacteria bacterium]|nr:LamG domain-containing protein [Candidatus Uhrbacteria bacterium]
MGDELVGRWDFDECTGTTAGDASGFGSAGVFTGTATWSTDTPSGQGCSARFDGNASGAVTISDADRFSFSNNSFTVSLWMKAVDKTSIIGMLSKIGGGWEYSFYTYPSAGQICFNTWNPGGASVYPFAPVSYDTKWNQFTISADGKNSYIYKDGSLVSTVAYSSGYVLGNTTSALRIGVGGDGSGTRYMNGFIDEVRIYNRALSSKEIRQMYVESLSRSIAVK